ncbi:hypothetical protein J6590_003459 [Homalodisca vitripennis]|nr:hypothetical protein J6590_003459 [Homalodisca vitripennis]
MSQILWFVGQTQYGGARAASADVVTCCQQSTSLPLPCSPAVLTLITRDRKRRVFPWYDPLLGTECDINTTSSNVCGCYVTTHQWTAATTQHMSCLCLPDQL